MNFTLAAMLGLTTMAQPPAADYYPLNSRNIKLPIEYKKDKRAIAQVQLFVCENGDQVWKQVGAAPPTQEAFVYNAPADGLYWFHIVIVDMQDRKDPANLTTEPPAMKVLVDTTRPYATFTNVRRAGEEITVEWKVEDKYPDEAATRVYFRDTVAPGEPWKEVTLHPSSRNGVRFKTGTSGPVVVRVAVQDLAGNTGEGVREFPAAGTNPRTTTSMSPGPPGSGAAAAPPGLPSAGGNAPPPAVPGPGAPSAPPSGPPSGAILPPTSIVPPDTPSGGGLAAPGGRAVPQAPAAPSGPVPSAPGGMSPPASPPVGAGMANPIASGQGLSLPAGPQPAVGQPLAQSDPRFPTTPGGSHAGFGGNVPAGYGTAPVSPTVEVSRVQVINLPLFDLNYDVEQGLSGISRVLLYVTRDDGQTWVKWSEHEGRGGQVPVRVVLNRSDNRQLEGAYGFRLVPISGAGLSDRPPAAGDTPDLKVVLDLTPPRVAIYPPTSDPAERDTLVLKWQAADANFGEAPIALEWSEHPSGPWKPVVPAEGVIPAAGGGAGTRVVNTGEYAWRVPPGLPPRVYLKVTARDAAGNTTEVVTPSPILVDLTKPRAKITGIGVAAPAPPRQ